VAVLTPEGASEQVETPFVLEVDKGLTKSPSKQPINPVPETNEGNKLQ